MVIHGNVQAVIDSILKGDILGTIECYYAEDVLTSENGIDEQVGKRANRAYEEQFVALSSSAAPRSTVVVDSEHAAVEWTFEFTPRCGQGDADPVSGLLRQVPLRRRGQPLRRRVA